MTALVAALALIPLTLDASAAGKRNSVSSGNRDSGWLVVEYPIGHYRDTGRFPSVREAGVGHVLQESESGTI